MAVTIEPKRRLRLPSGDVPEPKVVHSRSWLPLAVLVWIAAVVVGHGILYGWLPRLGSRSSASSLARPEPPMDTGAVPTVGISAIEASAPATVPQPRAIEPLAVDPERLPTCDRVADAESNANEAIEPLPVDLSRSPFGALLDTRYWTKPCRGAHPIRVHLCVAVKAGQLLGASATTEPNDASTSRCIIRAASKLPLEPEASLRKVHLTIDLPPDNRR